jgi:hypothetical protein
LIVALAAGVSAGFGDTASQAIEDAYSGLKALIKRRFTCNAKAEETFGNHEADPEAYEEPLAKQLKAAGARDGLEIVQKAQELLKKADEAGIKTKYKVQVTGGKVGIIGDHGHIDNLNVVTPRREIAWPVAMGSQPPLALAFSRGRRSWASCSGPRAR